MSAAGEPDRRAAAAVLERPGVARILALLNQEGEEGRVVGGAVRDALMGVAVREIDFATTAPPRTVMARAAAASIKVAPTGLDHGTVTLIVDGAPFEVTTLREDVATDGRRAKVAFSRCFKRDAERRDFTLNALSIDATGAIYDYVGGLADLAARRIRFIGEPRTRIREDYLRILRFFRFLSTIGRGAPDREALAAAIAEREGLGRLSRERVRAELLKLLAGARADEATRCMSETGLLQPLLGSIAYCDRLARLMTHEKGARADPLLRLAALAVVIEEDAARLQKALRLSNREDLRLREAARLLTALRGRADPPNRIDLQELLFAQGRRAGLDALALAWAEGAPEHDKNWAAARDYLSGAPQPVPPFGGEDLLARGLPSGRLVGATLKMLQARWIRAGFPTDPASVARLIDEAIAEARQR